ncbi:MAG: Hsp20 family protein [Gluconacetobacter diazotrophicus]|nr:Hsp20 family protein [Gluconacetobacter diazotrophicus]
MTYDFAPLFRSAIGFDRLARLVDSTAQAATSQSYPPYNIEKSAEDSYVLTMAVAGFGRDDIDVTVRDSTLVVTGRVSAQADAGEVLYRGIAARAFERHFALADHIQVEKADLDNGLLRIAVRRVVPEALKPRRIAIGATALAAPANDGQGTVTTTAA